MEGRSSQPFDHDDLFSMPEPSGKGRSPRNADCGEGGIPDELVDAFFDDRMDTRQTEVFFRRLQHRPDKAREVVGMQRALEALRRPVRSPDFSRSILNEVDRRRRWLHPGMLRRIGAARIAAAAALLLVVGGVYVAQRIAPDATRLTAREAPLGDFVQAVSVDAAGAFDSIPAHVTTLMISNEQRAGCNAVRVRVAASGCADQCMQVRIDPRRSSIMCFDEFECAPSQCGTRGTTPAVPPAPSDNEVEWLVSGPMRPAVHFASFSAGAGAATMAAPSRFSSRSGAGLMPVSLGSIAGPQTAPPASGDASSPVLLIRSK